jgi:hypothetical protein
MALALDAFADTFTEFVTASADVWSGDAELVDMAKWLQGMHDAPAGPLRDAAFELAIRRMHTALSPHYARLDAKDGSVFAALDLPSAVAGLNPAGKYAAAP